MEQEVIRARNSALEIINNPQAPQWRRDAAKQALISIENGNYLKYLLKREEIAKEYLSRLEE